MKLQWMFPDPSQIERLLSGPLVAVRLKSYIDHRPYVVIRSADSSWSTLRIDFDEETVEEQDQIAANMLAFAELRVADYKEKHGVAV